MVMMMYANLFSSGFTALGLTLTRTLTLTLTLSLSPTPTPTPTLTPTLLRSALILTVVLGISNCFMYPFWSVHARLVDFYKYYFFQTLSVRLASY